MKPERIILLGPSSHRYKGGVAHFTSCLADELHSRAELRFLSWEVLYPSFLSKRSFTNTSDKDSFGTISAEYWLHYMNPLSWFRVAKTIRDYNPRAVILSWVHPVHAPVYWVLMKLLKGSSELILLCHNVYPHENFMGAKRLSGLILKLADKVIVHSQSEAAKAKRHNPDVQELFMPLIPFADSHAQYARQTYNPQHPLKLLFFGVIRPYKGLDILLEALHSYSGSFCLTIAGEALDPGYYDTLSRTICALGFQKNVICDFRYIPNDAVASYFLDCDLAVYPYKAASSSAALTVAYQFGTPVVATNVGGLGEAVEDGKSGYLVEPNSSALAYGLERFKNNPLSSEGVYEVGRRYSWEAYADALLANP